MSKFLKAPLLEVIFEIRWNSTNKQEVDKFQLLIGALYAELKNTYEKPVNLLPDPNIPVQAFLDKPVFRARRKDGKPILYQVGPGILSINYVGADYDWEIFCNEIQTIVDHIRRLYGFTPQKEIQMGLKYLDFFDFEFDNEDLFKFLKEKFHLAIESDFINKPIGINFAITEKSDNDSFFNLRINTGTVNNQRKGMIVESRLNAKQPSEAFFASFEQRLTDFHNKLSQFFKSLTQGDLYESFKN